MGPATTPKGTGSAATTRAAARAAKLDAREVERDTKTVQATGRDPVPIEASVVEDERDRLGMAFTYKQANRDRPVLRDAFAAGRVASGRFEIESERESPAPRGPAAAA